MGLFEKNRCRKFFQFIQDWKQEDSKSHKKFNKTTKFSEVVKDFSLETNTVDFIGHAVALYTNDDFLDLPYAETVQKIQLYMSSIDRYGPSPCIYPIWIAGCLMYAWAAWSRKSAGMLANYILLSTIDTVGLIRMLT